MKLLITDNMEPTGINNHRKNDGDNRTFNLNGQRILHPQKGFFIQNGKKVIL